MSKQVTVKYCQYFNNQDDYKLVTHDVIDKLDFDLTLFTEIIEKPEFVRPNFDIDSLAVNSKDDWDKFINELERLQPVWGDYCIGGYCTEKSIHDITGLKYHETIEGLPAGKLKKISMHVVFYESKVKASVWNAFINKNSKYTQPYFIDDYSVYKYGSKQLFRHSLSYKAKTPQDVIKCSGNIIYPKKFKPSYLCVTPRSIDSEITEEDLLEILPLKPVKVTANSTKKVEQKVVKQDAEGEEITNIDVAYQDKSFTMSKPCFEALYKGFEGLTINADAKPCNEEITLWPLFSALYVCIDEVNITKDDFYDAVAFIKEHANLTGNAAGRWDNEIKRVREKNTKCTGPGALFTYMRIFNNDYYVKNVRKYCLRKCIADDDIKFDLKDEFSIRDIRVKGAKREYQIDLENEKLDYNAILNDLRRVLIIIDKAKTLYVFKQYDARTNRMTIDCCNLKDAKAMLKQLKVGTTVKSEKNNTIVEKTAWDIFDSNANNSMFYKRDITFYSEHPDDFSFYQGLKYEKYIARNDDLIKKINDHIRNILCKGNEECYNYVQSWFATIVQNPLGRCHTAVVIKGAEGTGKNTITDTWSELLAGYSIPNVSRIESIVGRFNSAIENKKLIVCNEMSSTEMNTVNIFDRLKAMITEPTIDIEVKGIDVRNAQNVSNYIFLSNNFNPIKITSGDRRYFIITPSEEVVGNRAYFNELYGLLKNKDGTYRNDTMGALLYQYLNWDISNFDPRNIPETLERVIAKEANKTAIEAFVDEYCIDLSSSGLRPDEAYDNFNRFCIRNGYQTKYKKTTFRAEMVKYCEVYGDGCLIKYKKQRVYRFTAENIKKYSKLVQAKMNESDDQIDDDDIPVLMRAE